MGVVDDDGDIQRGNGDLLGDRVQVNGWLCLSNFKVQKPSAQNLQTIGIWNLEFGIWSSGIGIDNTRAIVMMMGESIDSNSSSNGKRILVVGAGISGIMCARRLRSIGSSSLDVR